MTLMTWWSPILMATAGPTSPQTARVQTAGVSRMAARRIGHRSLSRLGLLARNSLALDTSSVMRERTSCRGMFKAQPNATPKRAVTSNSVYRQALSARLNSIALKTCVKRGFMPEYAIVIDSAKINVATESRQAISFQPGQPGTIGIKSSPVALTSKPQSENRASRNS